MAITTKENISTANPTEQDHIPGMMAAVQLALLLTAFILSSQVSNRRRSHRNQLSCFTSNGLIMLNFFGDDIQYC